MIEMLKRRREDGEEGFTLIELMVVVLIIAILIAIAIPTFLGAQNRARDRSAQSNLRNSLTAAKTIATDKEGAFDNVTVTELNTAEGAITHVAGANDTAPATGSVAVKFTSPTLYLWAVSASGKDFGIAADNTGKVGFCKGDTAAEVDEGSCAVTDKEW